MKKTLLTIIAATTSLVTLAACSSGQKPQTAPEPTPKAKMAHDADFDRYLAKVDSRCAYTIGKHLGTFKQNKDLGYRTAGSSAEYPAGKYLEEEMKRIGLTDISADQISVDKWEFEKANLTFTAKNGKKEKAILGGYHVNFDTNGPKDFQVVYTGKGRASDYDQLDVTGKLVLIDINQKEEWWVNYPALQARFKGAAAVLVSQEAGFSEVSDKALNAQDMCGPADAPIFSIAKHDRNKLKAAIDKGHQKVTFDAKSKVDLNQKTYNYSGKIEGKDKEHFIVYSAHYDAYFSGFQDNNMAVALMMSIAKAMIDSDYKPECTIVFTALAAEEWGVSDTRYDWSTGAYRQIDQARPEWVGKALMNINFELPAYEHESRDEIRSSYELKNYLLPLANMCQR